MLCVIIYYIGYSISGKVSPKTMKHAELGKRPIYLKGSSPKLKGCFVKTQTKICMVNLQPFVFAI